MVESEFFQSLASNDEARLRACVASTPLSPATFRNEKGCTALHMVTLGSSTSLLYLLLETVTIIQVRQRASGKVSETFRSWVSMKNFDGLTCLHYAFYNGRIECARIFLQMGAELQERTGEGYDVLWFAAQADQSLMVAFSQELQVPLTNSDKHGNTALHCAAKENSEFVANVLLALDSRKALINARNNLGQTPLMVAAHNGSRRIARNLLLRGADSTLRDHEGKRALDLALASNHTTIADMIGESWAVVLLGEQPMRPLRCRILPVCAVLLLLVLSNSFLVWKIEEEWSDVVPLTKILVAVVFALFFLLTAVGPGTAGPKNSALKLRVLARQVLYESHSIEDVCPDCVLVRPNRSHHCYYCNECIMKFDHHCPWVNCCVGRRNLGLFYAFLLVCTVDIVVTFVIAVSTLLSNILGGGLPLEFIASLLVTIICFTAFFPVSVLFFAQTRNFIDNVTTRERFSSHQAFSNSRFANCLDMCCDVQARVSLDTDDIPTKPSTPAPKDAEELGRPLI